MIGKTLGPYRILEPLGEGDMGEVWLAEDTRLGRRVAIKVLPAILARDADRCKRFEQEARAAAALNHPHIAAIHGVGATDDTDPPTRYMVQEHLEGETLREMLRRGPIPFEKSLKLAVEIGEGLEAAHRAQIVHRDLKPENVFVTPDGHAKILDFGLAKLVQSDVAGDFDAAMSPTVTMAGQILGTAGYMSPEQVRGGAVAGITETLKQAPDAPPALDARFDVILPAGSIFSSNYDRIVTISPDARFVAYTSDGLKLRPLDDTRSILVQGADQARSPAFSADSRQIAYWESGVVKRAAVDGGASVVVTPLDKRPMGMHRAADGQIYLGRADEGIWRVPG